MTTVHGAALGTLGTSVNLNRTAWGPGTEEGKQLLGSEWVDQGSESVGRNGRLKLNHVTGEGRNTGVVRTPYKEDWT